MSTAENRQLLQDIFARVAVGDGSLFVEQIYRLRDRRIVEITEYQDSTLCERVLGPFPTTASG